MTKLSEQLPRASSDCRKLNRHVFGDAADILTTLRATQIRKQIQAVVMANDGMPSQDWCPICGGTGFSWDADQQRREKLEIIAACMMTPNPKRNGGTSVGAES